MNRRGVFGAAILVWAAAMAGAGAKAGAGEKDARVLTYPNAAGLATTYDAAGPIDLNNAFFQDLGTNTCTCASCHQPDSAWTITPDNVERRFVETRGGDAIFRNNDGSNCEGAVATTVDEERTAYSLLLTRGLIRVGLGVPANAEFVIEGVSDPYHAPAGRPPCPSIGGRCPR